MSSAAVVYQSEFYDVVDTAYAVGEVDGIPVEMGDEELTRVGMFSIKEDRPGTGDAYKSDDEERASWMWNFWSEADIPASAFDSYDVARFWSHP
jgi:hypothetical protein